MTNLHLLILPYDSGYKDLRMGRGPDRFVQGGLIERLETAGHRVFVERIESQEDFGTEITTSFRLYRKLAERARAAQARGSFPLVLAGNCGSALGGLAGLLPECQGLAWFDAHGDFNTPETTLSGFLDGMALAAIAGRCWRSLAAGLHGFSPLPDDHIVHIGGRDFDPEEWALLERSGVGLVTAGQAQAAGLEAALDPALDRLAAHAGRIYVHVDLDVLDPQEAPANQFLPAGGLRAAQVEAAIGKLQARFRIVGAGLASYDPEYDPEGQALKAGIRLVEALVG